MSTAPLTLEEAAVRMDEPDGVDNLIEAWSDEVLNEGTLEGCPWLAPASPLVLDASYPHQGLQGGSIREFLDCIDRTNAISLNAYYRWEHAGCPQGRDEEFWLAAEAELYPPEPEDPWQLVNKWFTKSTQTEVRIYQHRDTGERKTVVEPIDVEIRLTLLLDTYNASTAWSLRAELKAMEKLRTLINDEQYRTYVLTGHFSENSKRSRLHYVFRKGRPTLVFSSSPDEYKPLCALCSHTIGYYQGTFAGVMCPTDEVIAHLMRMRHDEYNYWKRANQHPIHSELAGVG